MSGMIKLDRADLVVRTRPELIDDQRKYAVCISVNGHTQTPVMIRSELRTPRARPSL